MASQAQTARRALDRSARNLKRAGTPPRPVGGWIRAVRGALGMSAEQLGRRMGLTQQAVAALERSEVAEGIRLDSLRRAAEAMDCSLVYAFVPKTSLEDQVQRRAIALASSEIARINQTMLLEDQLLDGDATSDLIKDRVAELVGSRHLWDASDQ